MFTHVLLPIICIQVSGGVAHWSPGPSRDPMTSYSEASLGRTQPSQNESGFGDNDSDVTGSTHPRKLLHSPNSTSIGTFSSSDNSTNQLPALLSSYPAFPRSASVEDTSANEPANVLAAVQPRRTKTFSLSQEGYDNHFHPSTFHTLSQSSSTTHLRMGLNDTLYKPGSPASSSDTGSMTSSVVNRLGSGPACDLSFSTSSSSSSSQSNPHRLPRPPILGGSRGQGSAFPSSHANSLELSQPHPEQSPFHSLSQYSLCTPTQYDDGLSAPSLPVQPPFHSKHPSNHLSLEGQDTSRYPREKAADVQRRRREVKRKVMEQPKIPEEGNHRDSLAEALLTMVSQLSTHKDTANVLLTLSQSSETCNVMRQSTCLATLIQILHSVEGSRTRSMPQEARTKAAEALRNIVKANMDTRQGKYEWSVLCSLEKVRAHNDAVLAFLNAFSGGRRCGQSELEQMQEACNSVAQTLRKLYKYSNDKEHFRPAILGLGGLQAVAEVVIFNHWLIVVQKESHVEKLVAHTAKTVVVAISILINLTYGEANHKAVLCKLPEFLKALVFHLWQQNEAIIASGAQVLRNMSWRATSEIKDSLSDASTVLMAMIKEVKEEQTIQHITSALWNLSAHSIENRHKICSAQNGIQTLLELLSYNSPTGTTAVIENVGGILKNLSPVIMQNEVYRKSLREAGGLEKLAQHLKSKNKTVLSNATGVLWNLSARCPEDQRVLWDLGCVPLLDLLQTNPNQSTAECARGALRNLLAFGQSNGRTKRGSSKSLTNSTNSQNRPESGSKRQDSSESLQSRSQSNGMVDVGDSRGRGPSCDHGDGEVLMGCARPQAQANPPTEKEEWSSYRPGSNGRLNPSSPGSSRMDDHRKHGREARGREQYYGSSEGDCYYLSTEADFHGDSRVMCVPSQRFPGDKSSSGASGEPKMTGSYEAKMAGSYGNQSEDYADSDIENEEEEEEEREERVGNTRMYYNPLSDDLRDGKKMASSSHHISKMERLSPSKAAGTGVLSLDGAGEEDNPLNTQLNPKSISTDI